METATMAETANTAMIVRKSMELELCSASRFGESGTNLTCPAYIDDGCGVGFFRSQSGFACLHSRSINNVSARINKALHFRAALKAKNAVLTFISCWEELWLRRGPLFLWPCVRCIL